MKQHPLLNTIAARAKSRRNPTRQRIRPLRVARRCKRPRSLRPKSFRRTRPCSPERRLISQCRWWLGRRIRSVRRSFLIPDRRAEKRSRSLSCNGACPRTLLLSRPNDLIARSCEPLTGRRVRCAREALPSVCIQPARSTPIPFSMICNSSFRNIPGLAAIAANILSGCDVSLPPPEGGGS